MTKQDRYIPEALRDTGITYRQMDYWCRRGYLRPLGEGDGSGNPRWWPPQEIVVARRMAELVALGYGPAGAARVARGEQDAPMTACGICGGFDYRHDPVAHGEGGEEPCVCDTDFTCLADEHDQGRCDACETPGIYGLCCGDHQARMCPDCVERCHP